MRWTFPLLGIVGLVVGWMWSEGQLPAVIAQYFPPSPSMESGRRNLPLAPAVADSASSGASAPSNSTNSPKPASSSSHTILDCSFQVPSNWEVESESGDSFSARSGNKTFQVTTRPGMSNLDLSSAVFSNLVMLISPTLHENIIAETRDPFRGHPAYNALGHSREEGYDGGTFFVLGQTLYLIDISETNANPFNDRELSAIIASVTLTEPPRF